MDFYLPDHGIAIECQGTQHFKPSKFHHSVDLEENLKKITALDNLKRELCKINKVKPIYYTNVGLENYPYDIIENEKDLLNEIKKDGKNS